MMEINGLPPGASMVDATSCLNDEEMNRSMAVIRMDLDPGDSFSKWCILMYTKGNGTCPGCH